MKLTDFSALTFDCYGTLIDWETGIAEALEPWMERHSLRIGREELLAAFGRSESARQAERPGALYPDILASVMHDLGEQLGAHVTAEEAEEFGQSVKNWPEFPDSPEALTYLAEHYKLVITSNIDRASFRQSNGKLGVAFDLIITAEDVGSYKPAPGHFESAMAQLADMGIAKDKILHTAQSLYHDHVPAKAFGLASMWINRQSGRPGATTRPDIDVKPEWEVPSMDAMVYINRHHLEG